MPRVLTAIQKTLWREPIQRDRKQRQREHQQLAGDPKSARSAAVPVKWGEALLGIALVIEGDESAARYAWTGQMECGREHKYLLLVAWEQQGNTRAEQRVVPFEMVCKVVE